MVIAAQGTHGRYSDVLAFESWAVLFRARQRLESVDPDSERVADSNAIVRVARVGRWSVPTVRAERGAPVRLNADERCFQTFDRMAPTVRLEASEGEHVVSAPWDGFEYGRRVSIGRFDPPDRLDTGGRAAKDEAGSAHAATKPFDYSEVFEHLRTHSTLGQVRPGALE
jgi:hypothetical protein